MPGYDTVFEHRPLIKGDFISETFVNREDDIETARLFFDPKTRKDMVYVVHGESRIGKSHLAIYLMKQFENEFQMIYFYVNANTRGYALDILKDLFYQVSDYVASLNSSGHPEEQKFLNAYLNDVNNIFYGVPAKIALKKSRDQRQKLSPSFKGRFPFIDVQLGADQDQKKQDEILVELTTIAPDKLRDILSQCFMLLSYITKQNILLLVDDLDLLEKIGEGEKQRDILSNHLKHFSTIDPVTVFATSRTHYFIERQKELHNFLEVPRMSPTDLKSIYEKRIKCYLKGISIFTEDVLSDLVSGFQGYVGIFLYECFLILRNHVIKIHKNQMVDSLLLAEHFNKELSSFDSNPETKPVYDQIVNCVKINNTEITVDALMPSQGFVYRVLIPKGYQHHTYEILPIWVQAIKEFYQI